MTFSNSFVRYLLAITAVAAFLMLIVSYSFGSIQKNSPVILTSFVLKQSPTHSVGN
jgi:hypothetical protein